MPMPHPTACVLVGNAFSASASWGKGRDSVIGDLTGSENSGVYGSSLSPACGDSQLRSGLIGLSNLARGLATGLSTAVRRFASVESCWSWGWVLDCGGGETA